MIRIIDPVVAEARRLHAIQCGCSRPVDDSRSWLDIARDNLAQRQETR